MSKRGSLAAASPPLLLLVWPLNRRSWVELQLQPQMLAVSQGGLGGAMDAADLPPPQALLHWDAMVVGRGVHQKVCQ